MQAEALLPLFERLKEEGIHICLDTNGSVMNDAVRRLLALTDIVLLDVKEIDDTRHRDLTGRTNAATLAFADWLEENGREFWLRYVLVPGVTSMREDLCALCERFKGFRMLSRVEILPYHTLGRHKYDHLGMTYRLDGVMENTPEEVEAAAAVFRSCFDCVRVN